MEINEINGSRPLHWGLGILRDEAEREWHAIGKRLVDSEDDEDVACDRCEQETAAWRVRYGHLYPEMYGKGGCFEIMQAHRRLVANGVVSPLLPPPWSRAPQPVLKDFGGNVIPQRQSSRRNGSPYRKF